MIDCYVGVPALVTVYLVYPPPSQVSWNNFWVPHSGSEFPTLFICLSYC